MGAFLFFFFCHSFLGLCGLILIRLVFWNMTGGPQPDWGNGWFIILAMVFGAAKAVHTLAELDQPASAKTDQGANTMSRDKQ